MSSVTLDGHGDVSHQVVGRPEHAWRRNGRVNHGRCRIAFDEDVWTNLRRHAIAKIEARMRRLVVADVLPGDCDAVLMVVHQRVEALRRRQCRRVDTQRGAVDLPPDDLLPPVTDDVGLQAGIRLGSIVRSNAGRREQHVRRLCLPIPLRDPDAVEQLAQQIAGPPGNVIDRVGLSRRYRHAARAGRARLRELRVVETAGRS